MKKRLTLLLMTLSVLLTACSSKYDPRADYTCGWENGQVKFGSKAVPVDEYNGYTYTLKGGNGGIDYYFTVDTSAKDPSNITVNTQGITMDNMTAYSGKHYYLEYLGSLMTMTSSLGPDNGYMICQANITGMDANLIAKYMSDYMDTIKLTESYLYCDFGPFTFGNSFSEIVVRSDGASVKGVIKVSPGSKGATTPVQITSGKKTVDMLMTSTEKYDYYEYEGFLIQVAKGVSPAEYLTF